MDTNNIVHVVFIAYKLDRFYRSLIPMLKVFNIFSVKLTAKIISFHFYLCKFYRKI